MSHSTRPKSTPTTRCTKITSRHTKPLRQQVLPVTFIGQDSKPATLTINGDNIYRNGTKLNSDLVAECRFTDTTAKKGVDYRYLVTTVYDKGESRPSNEISLSLSQISNLAAEEDAVITTGKHCIVVTGLNAGDIAVYGVDGRILALHKAEPVTRIQLPSGAYIVKAGNTVAKVIVR